jgi:hypothetical protein
MNGTQKRGKVAPQLVLEVRQDHIDKGILKNASACMVAQAVMSRFPEAQYIRCDTREVSFSLPSKKIRRRYFMTPGTAKAVVHFDRGEKDKLTPFVARLNDGIEVPMGWRAKHPGSTRKHKLYRKTGKGIRYTKHRHFGACNISQADAEIYTDQ